MSVRCRESLVWVEMLIRTEPACRRLKWETYPRWYIRGCWLQGVEAEGMTRADLLLWVTVLTASFFIMRMSCRTAFLIALHGLGFSFSSSCAQPLPLFWPFKWITDMKDFILCGCKGLIIQHMGHDSTTVSGRMTHGFNGSCVKFTRVMDISGESLLPEEKCAYPPVFKGEDAGLIFSIRSEEQARFWLDWTLQTGEA